MKKEDIAKGFPTYKYIITRKMRNAKKYVKVFGNKLWDCSRGYVK